MRTGTRPERSDLDAALHQVTEGIQRCRQLAYTQPLATGLATLAWVRQAQGDTRGAMEAMEEAARAAPGPEVTTLLNPVPARRARLLLAQGDLAAASRPTTRRATPGEPEQLVLARVLVAQDRPDQALGLLERLEALAVTQQRTGSRIEIQALQALALAAAGAHPEAVATLAAALTLACRQGHVRVFADEGPPMHALLGRLVAAQRTGEPAARPRAGGARAAGRGPDQPGDRRGAGGHLDTVKKHVSHLLDKLGAGNRTEAVARARQLGLLR